MDIQNVWASRGEGDIQKCVKEAYEKQHYRVINFHESDRSHEGGVDLEVTKSDETIHIQIKVKPLAKDIAQLQKLAQSTTPKKIYIYVEDPAVGFKKEMEKLKSTVEFWDKSILNDYLISQNSVSYSRFLFLSTNLVRRIVDVLEQVISCEFVSSKNLEKEQLADWWRFKDRAVKLHACLEHIYSHYTKELLSKDRIEESEVRKYIEQIFSDFDVIHTNSCLDLLSITNNLKARYPFLLSKYLKVVEKRTNWTGFRDLRERKGIEQWILEAQPLDSSFYQLTNSYLRQLTEIGKAIEDGVDWVFEDSFGTSTLEIEPPR